MKILNLLAFCLVHFLFFGQQRFDVSFGLANLGQIDRTIEKFYTVDYPDGFLDEEYINLIKSRKIQYNLGFAYQLKNDFKLRLRAGYGQFYTYRDQNFSNSSITRTEDQSVFEITPSIAYCKSFDRISLQTGIEIPFYSVSAYRFKSHTLVYDTVGLLLNESFGATTYDPGFITGINQFVRLEFNLCKSIALYAEMNFGLLYAHLGDQYVRESKITYPDATTYTETFDKTYSNIFFSPPQMQFGLKVGI